MEDAPLRLLRQGELGVRQPLPGLRRRASHLRQRDSAATRCRQAPAAAEEPSRGPADLPLPAAPASRPRRHGRRLPGPGRRAGPRGGAQVPPSLARRAPRRRGPLPPRGPGRRRPRPSEHRHRHEVGEHEGGVFWPWPSTRARPWPSAWPAAGPPLPVAGGRHRRPARLGAGRRPRRRHRPPGPQAGKRDGAPRRTGEDPRLRPRPPAGRPGDHRARGRRWGPPPTWRPSSAGGSDGHRRRPLGAGRGALRDARRPAAFRRRARGDGALHPSRGAAAPARSPAGRARRAGGDRLPLPGQEAGGSLAGRRCPLGSPGRGVWSSGQRRGPPAAPADAEAVVDRRRRDPPRSPPPSPRSC